MDIIEIENLSHRFENGTLVTALKTAPWALTVLTCRFEKVLLLLSPDRMAPVKQRLFDT
jgi:hypothetical protein